MRYSVLSFGCRTNQADACEIEREMIAAGGVSARFDTADVVVVNTCTVTASADQAARRAIRRVARLNPKAKILVTGCYAARRPDEVGRLPGVTLLPSGREQLGDFSPAKDAPRRVSLRPGDRGRTAYPLRVQTGCDEQCAYCIVPTARGRSRSLPIRSALDEVSSLAEAGYKEIWLTGVHLGSYGRDLQPSCTLFDLLAALDREARSLDVSFRLGSLEPMDCSDEIVDLVARSPRLAPYLHLPLQHASDRMLEAMRRPYTASRYRALVGRIRERMPDAAIGSDLIAGFPGETDRDFDEQVRALQDLPLTHVHVFPYSDRPGTPAALMGPKVAGAETRLRAEQLRVIARGKTARFYERMVGKQRPALTIDDGSVALTDNYLKLAIAPGHARNERVHVRPTSANPPLADVVAASSLEP
jgi:threonylcarbamoyladenosine tRNA methylthiotransferase MtaB